MKRVVYNQVLDAIMLVENTEYELYRAIGAHINLVDMELYDACGAQIGISATIRTKYGDECICHCLIYIDEEIDSIVAKLKQELLEQE